MLTETVICQTEPVQLQLSCHQPSRTLYPHHILLTTAWVLGPSCTDLTEKDKRVTADFKARNLMKPLRYKSA